MLSGFTVPVTVNVTALFAVVPRLIVRLMFPVPPPPPHDVPLPVALQVQVTPVRAAGIVSVTVAPVTALGPPLCTTIV